MLESECYRLHIEMKDRKTKHDRAVELYGQYTFDTAIPVAWAKAVSVNCEVSIDEVYTNFVWLYLNNFGRPAPLTQRGCDILKMRELFLKS